MNEAVSAFDPSQFLNQETDSGMETEYQPVPEGEYTGVILNEENYPLDIRANTNDKGETSYVLDVNVRLDAPGEELADQKVVRYSCWLDLTPSGAFEMGTNKNVRLGRLREAVGQNTPGQPWAIAHLAGQPLKVKVKHSTGKDDRVYANVDSVGRIQ